MSEEYRRLSYRELYRNPWAALEVHDIVHPSGVRGEHVAIVTPPASAVLVKDGEEFLFARQPRFAAGRPFVEVVKGGADAGESPLPCAMREVREELGIEAKRWESLGTIFEIPSIVTHPVSLFLATDVRCTEAQPEEVESIVLLRMTIDEAFEAVARGDIDDAVTLAALLRYRLRG